jgi:hypothetical protein
MTVAAACGPTVRLPLHELHALFALTYDCVLQGDCKGQPESCASYNARPAA